MKRAISLMILLSLLLSACSSGGTTEDTTVSADTTTAPAETTTVETEPPKDMDDLPETMDFGDATIGIASSVNVNFHGYMDVAVSDDTTTVLDQSIYERNRAVEERLKVKFTEHTAKAADVKALTTNLISAGDDTYQIIHLADRTNFAQAIEGMYLDLATDVPHINLDKEYWYAYGNDVLNMDGHQYTAFGEMSLGTYDYAHMLVFNQELIKKYNLKSPYDYYKEDNWTFDTFATLVAAGKEDLNGDGTMDLSDSWGYLARGVSVFPLWYNAAGLQTVTREGDNTPEFTMPSNETFYDVYDWCTSTLMESGVAYTKDNGTNFHVKTPLFPQDQALFADISFFFMSAIRDMESDFGIMVYPKWTKDQDQYYAWVEGGAKSVSVSLITKNKEAVGASLEALGSLSLTTVIPTYYEINLKMKYSRDEISSQMFDEIRASRAFDLGDTVWCDIVREKMGAALTNATPLASTAESVRPVVEASIKDTLEKLAKLEESRG